MESEADHLTQKARGKLSPGFFEKLFSSHSSRLEEALDYYEKAANIYKLGKKWYQAGECYENCAKILEELKSDNSASHYNDAVHCFNFVDKSRANLNLSKCLKTYEKLGRFQQAGKIQKGIAEEMEQDGKYEEAAQAYKVAADYFTMENLNAKSYEQQCLLKYADLLCISNHKETLEIATKIYEKIGMQYLTVLLLQSGAKDLFFKCVVVFLSNDDYISAEETLKKFLFEDPTFENTRESTFLKDSIEAMKERNSYNFRSACTKLKTYSDFDKWKVHMFAKILDNIEKQDNDNFQ